MFGQDVLTMVQALRVGTDMQVTPVTLPTGTSVSGESYSFFSTGQGEKSSRFQAELRMLILLQWQEPALEPCLIPARKARRMRRSAVVSRLLLVVFNRILEPAHHTPQVVWQLPHQAQV